LKGQRQPAKEKAPRLKKGKALTLGSKLSVAERGDVNVMKLQMSENQECQSQVHVTVLRCLRVKPGKKGLNRRLRPVLQGGGLVLTNYLVMCVRYHCGGWPEEVNSYFLNSYMVYL
jgi:hypothetical protein